jgi:hypothetical protein
MLLRMRKITDLILRSLRSKRLEGWLRVSVLPILRDAAKDAAPQDEVRDSFTASQDEVSDPHGEERVFARLEP